MRYEYYLISLTLTYLMYNGYKKKWLIVYPSRGVNKIEKNDKQIQPIKIDHINSILKNKKGRFNLKILKTDLFDFLSPN